VWREEGIELDDSERKKSEASRERRLPTGVLLSSRSKAGRADDARERGGRFW